MLGFAVNGFAPNTQGELVILSTPTLLGTFTTDANGSFSGQAVIPAGFPVGNHTAVLITANLVTSMGLVVEGRASAAPVPYTGPMFTGFSNRFLPANTTSTVIAEGLRLSTIQSIQIAGQPVTFITRQTGDLALAIPALPAGTYDLVITFGGSAKLTHQSVFFVSERTAPPTQVPSVRVSSFAGNSFALTASARASIRSTINNYERITKVICTGSTSSSRVTASDRRLALQRAQAACDFVKQLRPSVETELRTNPAAGIGPRFRSTNIQIIEN